MIVIDNTKYEEAFLKLGEDKGRVKQSINMFVDAINIVAKYGYAILIDNDGNDIAVFRWEGTTYEHPFVYSGGLDMWFLNKYDVMILRGFNEYSMELCLTALSLWQGKDVIFAGADWQFGIELLPEIEGKNCIWEDELSDELKNQLIAGRRCVDINVLIPFQETLDRYMDGIMSYDEVMALTYMFSKKCCLGDKYPDKRFLVIDASYGNLGLFALYYKAVSVCNYIKKKGFIPILRIQNKGGSLSIYQDSEGDEIWGKFYNQPEGYKLEDVLKSKYVCFSPGFYNGSIMCHIMDEYSKGTSLSWPDGVYNDRVLEYLSSKEKEFLPYPEKTLGILARGTDYAGKDFKNHNIHASKEQIAEKAKELLDKLNLEYLFVATEDENYCKYFKDLFGDKVFFTDQERYTTNPGEMLAGVYRRQGSKVNAFQRGADYILAIYLLSKCDSLLASGKCGGTTEAIKMNKGSFKETYIFELGTVD